jgi:hypothetical protein
MSTNCIGSCKSNYHMIMTTTAHVQLGPNRLFIFLYSIILYIYLWKNLCFYYYRENFSFPSFLGNCLCDLDLSHNNLNQVDLSVSNLALLHCLDISQYVYIYSQSPEIENRTDNIISDIQIREKTYCILLIQKKLLVLTVSVIKC